MTAVNTYCLAVPATVALLAHLSRLANSIQTRDLHCSVIAMDLFTSRLKQKGFVVSFNPKGDGSCIFSAAAHQLKQDGVRLKEATFDHLLSHRFDVSIFIHSHYEHRNRYRKGYLSVER